MEITSVIERCNRRDICDERRPGTFDERVRKLALSGSIGSWALLLTGRAENQLPGWRNRQTQRT